ncbi:glycine zipper domain-containing protein [Planctomicrobium sp. SH664]|uniref:glycine zipper domain-containing protein n=1 Tax=Planctomicrobium sp. SH664 TaxID=3448125 RepID=UPI003F5B27BD
MNHAQSGTLMGTGMGATVGAIVGNATGNPGAGALIGGVTGAIAGNAIGTAEDAREERDMAIHERNSAILNAAYTQQVQQQAMTNFDLIRLAQSGVSEDVIINMIRTRGGKFDLSTDSIITLKSNGVSDRVIVAAQTAPAVAPAPSVMAVPSSPGVVVVEPAPPVEVIYAPRPLYWGHRHPHWHHRPYYRSGVSFGVGF